MFEKVLIANRGEIAIRIAQTLKELNIKSVAVYSEADRNAPHVWAADEAFEIGPAAAAESYLNIDAVLKVAKMSGVDAIHPGYGFLGENTDFASAVADAGLTFIGPSPESMGKMGDKSRARELAENAGVPVTPGVSAMSNPEEILQAAMKVGFPLLLKASAGGGGKGMRLVEDQANLADSIEAAQREAKSSFGDERLIVEKYIQPARHIEVQIMADQHGNVVALGERECSLQRRHQKIIEESPSPVVNEDLREKLYESACNLVRAVNYSNAGTVEFLLGPDDSFYFMEMNARLQVEHPVTELVTGLDLVQMQLEVAAGQKLSVSQNDIKLHGHAIEARLYAEDAKRDFLPMTGEILALHWPNLVGFRVDSGISLGQEIHAHYDPMLAKLVSWGSDREQARRRLIQALTESAILGLVTNRDFLIKLLKSEMFSDSETFTNSIEQWIDNHSEDDDEIPVEMLLAATLAFDHRRTSGNSLVGFDESDPHSPWKVLGGWRHLE
jgi:acetyl-CoA carboxylase biotin carboxylase subunit